MEHRDLHSIEEEEETVATPRFADAPAEPKRVVPLERIRARTASAVRRVRYRVRPADSGARQLNWLPLILLFLLAGAAGGYFLATRDAQSSAEDAPIVRSELEAEPAKSNSEAKKSAFVERNEPIPSFESANFASVDASAETADNSDSSAETTPAENKLLTVEEEPAIATEVRLREEEQASKQAARRRETERREIESRALIRREVGVETKTEGAESNRRSNDQKPEENREVKPKAVEQEKKPEPPANSNREESANSESQTTENRF